MKRTKKSQSRSKFLFVLIILTAILSITATYAWFSTQRDVEIVGMRINVEVAESLQISLDGETWVQSIDIDNMRQLYGTYGVTGKHQAKTTNTNYVPTELLPVSSDGTVTSGKLNFVTGKIEGKKLSDISACNEDSITNNPSNVANKEGTAGANNAAHPYLVFDMYLRNISAKEYDSLNPTLTRDTLKLDKGSRVWVDDSASNSETDEGVGKKDVGLEASARVGFILYGNTVDINATDTTTTPPGGGAAVTTTVGEQVRGITSLATDKAAIWEPNHLYHTTYVVSNDDRITQETAYDEDTGIVTGDDYVTLPIQSTKTSGSIEDVTIVSGTNVAAAGTTGKDLASGVVPFRPAYYPKDRGTLGAEGYAPAGVKSATAIHNTSGNSAPNYLQLMPNTISKVRVYIWLEGQDPDCVDFASTGGRLDVILKFIKDATDTVQKPSYVGDGSGAATP